MIFALLIFFFQSSEEKIFLYDIVANGRNGIDVDKYISFHFFFLKPMLWYHFTLAGAKK